MNGHSTSARKLLIMRHAERVDFTFGERGAWIFSAFDDKGFYKRTDLNMPQSLPSRRGGPKDFHQDSPITRIGHFQALITGEALKYSGIEFSHVFSSPALRCIETCTSVLKGAGLHHLPINVEPGLFECMSIYKDVLPVWMDVNDLKNNGFNVSQNYSPVIPPSSFPGNDESVEEYYERAHRVTKELLQQFSGNLLFLTHAGNLDACSRQLTNKPVRNEEEANRQRMAYASVVVVEEDSDETWHLVDPPFSPLTHASNSTFEWRQFL